VCSNRSGAEIAEIHWDLLSDVIEPHQPASVIKVRFPHQLRSYKVD